MDAGFIRKRFLRQPSFDPEPSHVRGDKIAPIDGLSRT
jgi:hypothetical protein